MKIKQTQKNIPDGWTGTTLSNLLEFKNGLNKEKEAFGQGTPIVNYMDVCKKTSLKNDDVQGLVTVLKNELVNNSAQKGDVFFTRTSETLLEIGMASVLLVSIKDCVFSGYILRGRPKSKEVLSKYWAHSLRTSKIRKEIMRKSSMTTRALTTGKFLGAVEYLYPPEKEQKRIIHALDTWDGAIEGVGRKIEIKKNIKKGLMQRLLTGKVRLPGFSEEWKVEKLEDISTVKMGQSPSSEFYNEKSDGIPLIQGNNDIQNKETVQRIWTTQITKTAEYGEIIMTVRAPVGWVAKTTQKVCLGRGVCSIQSKNSINEYLFHFLVFFEKRWRKYEQGSTFTAVNGNDIRKLKILIPSNEECTVIANILTTTDKEIETLEKQLSLLKDQKKYLLNNLVTGAIRTPEIL